MKAPLSMWFYKESYCYNQRFQGLCGSIKNNTGTNRDFRVYVVLQRIILVQMNVPFFMWFCKKSYWYNQISQGLCGSTKNNTGTNRDLRFLDSVDIFKSKLKAHLFFASLSLLFMSFSYHFGFIDVSVIFQHTVYFSDTVFLQCSFKKGIFKF